MFAKEILREFIFECEIRKYSKRTIKGYRNNLDLFLTYTEQESGITELEKISALHIKQYMQYLIKRSCAENYANGILKCLRSFFKYAVQEEYLQENPCKRVSWQREPKVLIQAFTDEEVSRIINLYSFNTYLEARNKTILAVLIDTGMRCFELCELRQTAVRDGYVAIQGKGNKERHVGISPMLRKYLVKYERARELFFYNRRNLGEAYFLSRTGRPLTNSAVENIVKEAGKLAKVREDIRCSPHTCRHYFAQAQLRNGLDVYSLSGVLGHENITITKRYYSLCRMKISFLWQ